MKLWTDLVPHSAGQKNRYSLKLLDMVLNRRPYRSNRSPTVDKLHQKAFKEAEHLQAIASFIDDEAVELNGEGTDNSRSSISPSDWSNSFSPNYSPFTSNSDEASSPASPQWITDDSVGFSEVRYPVEVQRARKRKISESDSTDSIGIPIIYLSSDDEI